MKFHKNKGEGTCTEGLVPGGVRPLSTRLSTFSVAPEILNYNPITTAADLWSLGAVLYVMLSGYSPFAGDSLQETYLNVAEGTVILRRFRKLPVNRRH